MSTAPPTASVLPAADDTLPAVTFVAGPRGAGKTRWVQRRVGELAALAPATRCAVLLAEEGRTRLEAFVRARPEVAVRRLLLPCLCCPANARLPETMAELREATNARHFFIEVPAVAAAGLLGEFDRALGWPRRVVLCLDAAWAALREREDRPLFLTALLERADEVVVPGPAGETKPAETPTLELP